MGLAGPKRRTKISADPNNTNWSRNSSSFGHRILAQQGWTPGSYLGAVDAAHASHYTAANASHVRVLLKDDNLGLGASRKKEGAETFGLDQFSGLLGRLNGKDSAVLKKEESNRRDVKLRLYQEGKFGGIRFVSAGFLIGDEVKDLKRSELERRSAKNANAQAPQAGEVSDVKKGKKRGRNGDIKEQLSESSATTRSQTPVETTQYTESENEKSAKLQRKEERRQKRAERAERREQRAAEKIAKAERRQRKLERRKEQKAEQKGGVTASQTTSDLLPETGESNADSGIDSAASPAPSFLPRNSVRQRYIRQKRMAGLDPKALKEIFMIKSSA
ncbi:hypothetical protein K461DRAFT_234529 [Myriangium duriaei CBS 260.36]|uniref:PinX1-related protein 1 n=1 Tax=Myriangium duriaei CBS 260.36 TaxID=1168546 RepID=A0A9P4JD24_9PEZI|nr:hypothetical protein K461DRAFT_234529 [Myriangium duriaei CBS 260.36]